MSDDNLTSFIEDSIGDSRLRVETDFGDGFVRLRSSEAQRRQAAQDIRSTEDIIIELLRNARDAGAHSVFLSFSRDEDLRSIVCIDDGSGIPKAMHGHVFEPRVTSKLDTADMDRWGLHGRGMALYSITVNAKQAEVACSEKGLGTAIRVITDLTKLGEKTDQSTFPVFKTEQGVQAMRGPKNALRTAAEFALEHRDTVKVYFGSPAEIASTLYAFGNATLTPVQRAFASDMDILPVVLRLSAAADPESFRETAEGLGLNMSVRTARRIMDGSIEPVVDLLERMRSESFPDVSKRRRRLSAEAGSPTPSLGEDDLEQFKDAIASQYAELAKSYYLDETVEPSIVATRGELVIRIPLKPAQD